MRDLFITLKTFRFNLQDLIKNLKEERETKGQTNTLIRSLVANYPKIFRRPNKDIKLRNKNEELQISAEQALNPDDTKFFATYIKQGTPVHFYFSKKSVKSQCTQNPPLGFDRTEQIKDGEKGMTYFFSTNARLLYSALKSFETQIQEKNKSI